MIDFETFTKLLKNVVDLGVLIVCQRFEKVAQSSINRPIWSQWPYAWLLPLAGGRLPVGDLHAVGWGEGP